jgi:hypothetical protein
VELHPLNTFERFESADQDAAAYVWDFGADVQHEVIAIGEVDVRVSSAQKHRAIAGSWSAKVMCGGIARRVGFGLNDAAAKSAGGMFADNDFADQITGQVYSVGG